MAKRRVESQFDSRPLKVKNHLDFLACRWHATYRWKDLDESYNFASNFILIRGLHAKLWAPKVVGVLIMEISGLSLWESRDKMIWVLVLWPGTKYTIRGKVVASPKSGLWWVLWVYVCMWLVHAPKCFNYALINLLFGLCRFVWIKEMFVNLPSPIPEL
jgi:hypothetical protein